MPAAIGAATTLPARLSSLASLDAGAAVRVFVTCRLGLAKSAAKEQRASSHGAEDSASYLNLASSETREA